MFASIVPRSGLLGWVLVLGMVMPGARPPAAMIQAASRADSMNIPILVYHSIAPHRTSETRLQREYDVSPEVFEAQMSWLAAEGITVLSFGALVDIREGKARPPGPAVVITFDDGWESQYRYALPVLRRFGYPATFFVFTNPIGRRAAYLSWEQLGGLREAGMTIGSHTMTHPNLVESDSKMRWLEIERSRRILQDRLHVPVEFFAYPFGAYSDAVVATVQRAGYRAGRSYPGAHAMGPQTVWSLRAVGVGDHVAAFRNLVRSLVNPISAGEPIPIELHRDSGPFTDDSSPLDPPRTTHGPGRRSRRESAGWHRPY